MSTKAIEILAGSSRTLTIRLQDAEGDPVDVSTATAIKALFKPNSGSTLLERTLADSQIAVANGREKITVTLSAAFTATMLIDEDQDFEVEATIAGLTYVWRFKEALTVSSRLSA